MSRFVSYRKLFRLYEFIQPYLKYSIPLDDRLPGKSVLVIAPHPDDEAIGCGGAVCRHVAVGGTADLLVCTMDEARKTEVGASARVLGIRDTISLGYPVESLGEQAVLAEQVFGILKERQPDILFVPFLFDNHQDHRAVNEALIKGYSRHAFDCMVYAYPVWFPLHPNVVIDIGPVWATKKQAIECYPSQLATRDYVTMSHALGQYWARVKGHGLDVVESFFRATLTEYISLGKKMLSR
jgi:LmbE family N-acetylglucosaminyl deacetylase